MVAIDSVTGIAVSWLGALTGLSSEVMCFLPVIDHNPVGRNRLLPPGLRGYLSFVCYPVSVILL